ncbi:hypothetical protein UFOVP281_8 [uncultured Caudovirales phage]|uniref:Uncharacterized protein n=1 Tax=uncultured Caudovirales phage TaxID=2100421 RepID=A0A6J5LJS5_9CAUD|nr:hypothetical protein UFOVP281_8 [uncultured Caudovirales phage]
MRDTFTFKKKMIKAILNDGEFNTKLPKETVEFVEQYLLDHNPLIKQLIIRDLWIQPNDTFKHNNFYFNGQVNNKIVRFSLLSTGRCSANPIKVDSIDYTINAMRTAVAGHIQHIKKHLLNVKHQTKCEICNKELDLINTDKIHMHHSGELQFRHIADMFLDSGEKLIVADKKDQAGTYELIDNDAKDLWINFHNELADLQMVCATCNLTEKKL